MSDEAEFWFAIVLITPVALVLWAGFAILAWVIIKDMLHHFEMRRLWRQLQRKEDD